MTNGQVAKLLMALAKFIYRHVFQELHLIIRINLQEGQQYYRKLELGNLGCLSIFKNQFSN